MSYHCFLFFFSVFFLYFFAAFCSARGKDKWKGAHPQFDVPGLPYPLVDASAPANELAKQLPASGSSLAVPPLAANTAEAVDLSAGRRRDPGPAAAGAAVATASTRADFLTGKKDERRGYMHQVFILSYPRLVYLLLPFCFLVIRRRRVYVLVHGLRFCVRDAILTLL